MPRPIEFNLAHGIVTNVRPHDTGPGAFQQLVNADHFDRIGAISKVPGSTRVSVNASNPVVSLNFYGHFDLARRFQREALALAGGSLSRIESDGTLTPVAHGFVSEPLSELNTLDRIHLASPNNDPVKFDGHAVTRWGVLAPGEREIVLDALDDQALYVISGGTKATATDFSKDGSCIEVDKTSIVTDQLSLTRSGLTISLVPYGDALRVWLYVPPGGLSLLRGSSYCVEVGIVDSAVNVNFYRKTRGELAEGWNRLAWVTSAPSTSAPAPADLSDVVSLAWKLIFETPTTLGAGFRWDRFHTTEDGAPVPTIAGAGAVTGRVRYSVSFVSRYGQQSNAGTASVEIDAGDAPNGSQIQIEVPVSSDDQVVARRIYRDQDDDQLFRLVGILFDNTTSVFLDNVAPDARDLQTPPLPGDAEDDNSVAPRMSQVALFKNHGFGIDAENPFQLNISAVGEIESWPLLNRPQFDEHLVAISAHRVGLSLYTRNPDVTYILQGDTLADFRFERANPVRAAAGRRVAVPIKTLTFYWHDDGPFIDDGDDPWFLGAEIHNRIVSEIDPTGLADAFVVNDHARLRLVCFLRGIGSAFFEKVLVYEYGKRAAGVVGTDGGVDPLDVRLGSWHELRLPAGIDPRCAAMIERDADDPQLWVGCGDGYVYRLQPPGAATWARGNAEEGVAMTVQSGRAPFSDGDRFGRPGWLILEGRGPACTFGVTVAVYSGAAGALLASTTFDVSPQPGANGEWSIRRRIPDSRKLRGAWVDVTITHDATAAASSIERLAIEPLHDRTPARAA
jgi:hypothetical protein